jgi:CheY-like chemotaxis protein
MLNSKELNMTFENLQEQIRPLETLVLDDDYRWRYLLASNVESHLGTQPVLASRGAEALDIMTERPIDVVIADLLMPGMDGLQFLQRAHDLFPRTKIIVLSADFDTFPIAPGTLIEHGALAAIPKTEISSALIPMLQVLQKLPDMVARPTTWGTRTPIGWSGVN